MFLSRIGKSLLNIIVVLLVLALMVFCIILVGGLIFWLPTWLLSKVNNIFPLVYIVSVLLGMMLCAEWKHIKFWFYWQFIEPFKTRTKVTCMTHTDGFTIGKKYEVLGVAGEHIQLVDDDGDTVIVDESSFWSDKR